MRFHFYGPNILVRTVYAISFLLALPILNGCVVLADSSTRIPELTLYGRTLSPEEAGYRGVPFKLVAVSADNWHNEVIHLADPSAPVHAIAHDVHDVNFSLKQQPLHTFAGYSRPTQRAYIWAGAMAPVSPRFGNSGADHIVLLWQSNSPTLYRLSQNGRRAKVHEISLDRIRVRLSELRARRKINGMSAEQPLLGNKEEMERFWKGITWHKSETLQIEFIAIKNANVELSLTFNPSSGRSKHPENTKP
ncbi:MAG: hypothetical protein L3K26_15650 [Candidatus Hydrogenedentes bacterium]|nr:hypothetical protein [Candidatus Hydrogenedentota bacterium]